jgi:aminopeptidase N
MSELTGVRYPYPKYSQAVVANFPFGGMENISATTLTDAWMVDERGALDMPPEGLIAHEAAHQWFGDLLTCADWSHIWLNEGWATYATALFTEHAKGREAFEVEMADLRDGYLALDVAGARRPVVHATYRDPMDLFTTGHVYPGAASRLHQLRFELGDEVFFAGVRKYFADYRGRAVVTADFQAAMQTVSGRNLSKFFHQWFLEPGYPELSVSSSYNAEAGRIEVDVEQVHAFADRTPQVFRFEAEIEIADRKGGLRSERITIERRRQSFRFPVEERPRWVLFDPHGCLCARVSSTNPAGEWVAIAEGSAHPLARRSALIALSQAVRQSTDERARAMYVQAIEQRLADDASPGVRRAAAQQLGELAPAFGSVALQNAATSDADSGVRIAALISLKGFLPDERLRAVGLDAGLRANSWATKAAAVALEAAAEPASAFEHLTAVLAHFEQEGAGDAGLLTVLAGISDPRVEAYLLHNAFGASNSSRVRAAAVIGLGRISKHSPEVRRQVESLLLDPDYGLRGAAITALGSMADPQSLPAIEAAYPKTIDSRQRRALEALMRAPWAAHR